MTVTLGRIKISPIASQDLQPTITRRKNALAPVSRRASLDLFPASALGFISG